MTYSTDFRRKVSEIKKRDGPSFEETAVRFGVGKSGAGRWAKRPEPCRSRNEPAVKIDMELPAQDVALYPDAYRHERAERLGCSRRGISDALKRLKISRKKNSLPSESGRSRTKCFQQRNQGNTVLNAVPYFRYVGREKVAVSSLGEPEKTEHWRDTLGRRWNASLWYLPYSDHFLYSRCIPSPNGAVCIMMSTRTVCIKVG